MTPLADLTALLAFLDEVPVQLIPVVLAALAAAQGRLAARLLAAVIEQTTGNNGAGEDRLLTLDQASARLACSRDWLKRHSDDFGAVRLSRGQRRFSAAALDAFLAARRSDPR